MEDFLRVIFRRLFLKGRGKVTNLLGTVPFPRSKLRLGAACHRPSAICRRCAMAKNRDWQERGVRIAGKTLSEQEVALIVQELRKRVDDPVVVREMEEVLSGKRKKLSDYAQSVLIATLTALFMMRPK